ncbi:MAG: hypothetical protein AAGD34_16050 [Pseudomonadota bacterium]
MSGRCYIVANMLPPHFGWHTRAPSLRAEQLAAQARTVFDDVRYLIFQERHNLLKSQQGFCVLTTAKPDTVVLRRDGFEAFVNRIPKATFVFSQADFVDEARLAAGAHTIVYDILAPKALELEVAGAGIVDVRRYERHHARMIDVSARVFVNGRKSQRLFAGDLAEADHCLNPFAPSPSRDVDTAPRTHVMFGGEPQRWTDSAPMFDAMASFLAGDPQTPAFMISATPTDTQAVSRAHSALWLLPNVTAMWNLSPLNYGEALARSVGFVDWTPLNRERAYATSTRVLQAVSAGVPVLHQAGTGLDEFWDAFPGKALEGPITPDAIGAFVRDARAGAFTENVAKAQEAMRLIGEDGTVFAGLA